MGQDTTGTAAGHDAVRCVTSSLMRRTHPLLLQLFHCEQRQSSRTPDQSDEEVATDSDEHTTLLCARENVRVFPVLEVVVVVVVVMVVVVVVVVCVCECVYVCDN